MKRSNVGKTTTNENMMPRLFGSPSPDAIRKFLLKSKNYLASKTSDAWEIVREVPLLDEDGDPETDDDGNELTEEVVTTESMLTIFPDGSTPGRYPQPITVEEPVAVVGESSFDKEKKTIKWKNELMLFENQRKSIINGKLSYAGELKMALAIEVQDVMRRQASGRAALDNNDPLEIIKCLMETDFSPKATVAATPMVKFNETFDRFMDKEKLKQEFHESLDAWEKRYGAELNNLTNLAIAANMVSELPSEANFAYRFFCRANGLYDRVRDDIKTGARPGGYPKTIEAAMELLRPYEKPVNRNNNNNNESNRKGVFVAQSNNKSDKNKSNRGGWSHLCPAHRTNEHSYNDTVCQEIIMKKNSDKRNVSEQKRDKIEKAVNNNRKSN